MHFQEIRRAAAQGTISLPPPADSEGLEDLAVLKSCLKVIRELSGFRYAFAKDAMAETFAPLMASVEAKNELERQGLKVSLKSYFLSLILKDLENPDILLIDNYINALFNSANEAANGPITVQTVVNVVNSFPQDGINWRENPQTDEEQILLQPDTFPDSKAVQVELARWEKYSKELRDLDPLVHALLTNLYFMAISPLNRHNGRVTQILLQLSLMGQNINSPAPCLMLGRALMTNAHFGIEERLYGLRTRQWSPYLQYMLKTLSKAILLSGELLASLQRLYAQTEAYLKMIGLASHAAFLPVIFKHPACRTGEFSSIFTTRRQVASHILNDLARAGILERVEDGRDRVFYHTRLIELLESESYKLLASSCLYRSVCSFVSKRNAGTNKTRAPSHKRRRASEILRYRRLIQFEVFTESLRGLPDAPRRSPRSIPDRQKPLSVYVLSIHLGSFERSS